MISTEIITELNESTSRLLRELGRFDSHRFNHSLTNGIWNAGQVAEHILLTDIAVFRVMQGGFTFAGRRTDEKVEAIKKALQNRDRKLQAPSAATPSDFLKDPVMMQQKISGERSAIIQFLNTVEEDSICTLRENRNFGPLTVTEWIWFIIYHTDRHIEQLKELDSDN